MTWYTSGRGTGGTHLGDAQVGHTWEMRRQDTPGRCAGGTHLGDVQVRHTWEMCRWDAHKISRTRKRNVTSMLHLI